MKETMEQLKKSIWKKKQAFREKIKKLDLITICNFPPLKFMNFFLCTVA